MVMTYEERVRGLLAGMRVRLKATDERYAEALKAHNGDERAPEVIRQWYNMREQEGAIDALKTVLNDEYWK